MRKANEDRPICVFYQNNRSSSMFLEIFSGNAEALRKVVMGKNE